MTAAFETISDVARVAVAAESTPRPSSSDPATCRPSAPTASRADSPIDTLTTREREVLGQVAEGKNNAAIASALFLSDRAVEKHINSIFSKLGLSEEQNVHRRVKAALLFLSA